MAGGAVILAITAISRMWLARCNSCMSFRSGGNNGFFFCPRCRMEALEEALYSVLGTPYVIRMRTYGLQSWTLVRRTCLRAQPDLTPGNVNPGTNTMQCG